jgi:hypothetical protein
MAKVFFQKLMVSKIHVRITYLVKECMQELHAFSTYIRKFTITQFGEKNYFKK